MINVARLPCTRPLHLVCKSHRTAVGVVYAMQRPYSRSVAIIGAGAAGLAAAKELLEEGHQVQVFEQGSTVGGVWLYDPNVETDLKGADPSRKRVHSSMYASLRTNLPREIMGYGDLPFTPEAMNAVAKGARSKVANKARHSTVTHADSATTLDQTNSAQFQCHSEDSRRYCTHCEVLRYLNAYATYHNLLPVVSFNTHVKSVTPEPAITPKAESHVSNGGSHLVPTNQWKIITQSSNNDSKQQQWQFDAVVVANGHYSEPSLPDLPGMDIYPGVQIHSHNYRSPEAFRNKVVLVIGAANSGDDISREVAQVAKRVLVSARSWPEGADISNAYGHQANMYRRPMVSELTSDSQAVFPEPWGAERVDAVIYCIGYKYDFPFLHVEHQQPLRGGGIPDLSQPQDGVVRIGEGARFVAPLYKHLFPPSMAPWLSFIGLPWKVVPFPQMQLQAKLVARALSGKVHLPPPAVMQEEVEQHFIKMKERDMPIRYAHMQNMDSFAYNAELAEMCGIKPLPSWREHMYVASGKLKRSDPDYRDASWSELGLEDVLQDLQDDLQAQLDEIVTLAAARAV